MLSAISWGGSVAETYEQLRALDAQVDEPREAAVAMGQIRTDRGVAGSDGEVIDPAVLDVCVGVQIPAAEVVSIDLEIRRLGGRRPAPRQTPGEIERQGGEGGRRGHFLAQA